MGQLRSALWPVGTALHTSRLSHHPLCTCDRNSDLHPPRSLSCGDPVPSRTRSMDDSAGYYACNLVLGAGDLPVSVYTCLGCAAFCANTFLGVSNDNDRGQQIYRQET